MKDQIEEDRIDDQEPLLPPVIDDTAEEKRLREDNANLRHVLQMAIICLEHTAPAMEAVSLESYIDLAHSMRVCAKACKVALLGG